MKIARLIFLLLALAFAAIAPATEPFRPVGRDCHRITREDGSRRYQCERWEAINDQGEPATLTRAQRKWMRQYTDPEASDVWEADGNVLVVDDRLFTYHGHIDDARKAELDAEYVDPVIDDREWRQFWIGLLGHGLDVASTRAGLKAGCVEGNGLVGSNPSTAEMIMVKLFFVAQWAWEAHQSPRRFSSADLLVSKVNVASGYVAAGLNLRTIAAGCVR